MPNNQSLNNKDEKILNRRDDVNFKEHDIDDVPSVDRSGNNKEASEQSPDDRKYKPDIDGPQQASQETDDIYVDPRANKDLPPAGKKVDELSAFDLSKESNK